MPCQSMGPPFPGPARLQVDGPAAGFQEAAQWLRRVQPPGGLPVGLDLAAAQQFPRDQHRPGRENGGLSHPRAGELSPAESKTCGRHASAMTKRYPGDVRD